MEDIGDNETPASVETVALKVIRAGKTLKSVSAQVRDDCTVATTVRLTTSQVGKTRVYLDVTARYGGNGSLRPVTADLELRAN